MSTPWLWPPLLGCLSFALACGPKHPPAPDTPPSALPTTKTTLYSVVGTATYRERIAMPLHELVALSAPLQAIENEITVIKRSQEIVALHGVTGASRCIQDIRRACRRVQ